MKKGFFGILALMLIFGMAIISCDNGNDEETFTSSTNETISNNINSLGLVGTSVSSSNVNVATAVIASGKIKITSVGEGSAVITVTESSKNATINVSVSEKGTIIIGTITKYSENVKTIVGSWTKTESDVVLLLVINDDGTWNLFFNENPHYNDLEYPGIWSETDKTIGVWYDYISETHPEPGYVYATYTLSENGDSFTLSGDAELLFGGPEPWTRVNNL